MVAIESDFVYRDHRCVTTFTSLGIRCGYVRLSDGEDERKADYYDVHGGITYVGNMDHVGFHCKKERWIGFDCGHYGDKRDIERLKELWPNDEMVGDIIRYESNFYSNNIYEEWTIKDLKYVQNECRKLVDQLIEDSNNEQHE